MPARKGSGAAKANTKNKNTARAAEMKKQGIMRTTFRDPITNGIVTCGTYPGTRNRKVLSPEEKYGIHWAGYPAS